MVNFESMTKNELIRYAEKKHGLKLSDTLTKERMIQQIENLENTATDTEEAGVEQPATVDVMQLQKQIAEQSQLIAQLQKQMLNVNNKPINTSTSIYDAKDEAVLVKSFGEMAKKFKAEKQVKVMVPVAYAKITGSPIPINVMGCTVNIPADSREYEIPETFAKHLKTILKGYDLTVFNAPARDIQEVK